MTGAVVSRTVTVNEAVPILSASSTALRLTVVSPIWNRLPEAGTATTSTWTSTSSSAVSVKFTKAPPGRVASAAMSAGTEMTGGVTSDGDTVVLVSTPKLREFRSTVPMSGFPSPLKLPTNTWVGYVLAGKMSGLLQTSNPSDPLVRLPMRRSGLPSLFTSATATEAAWFGRTLGVARSVPSPLPKKTSVTPD